MPKRKRTGESENEEQNQQIQKHHEYFKVVSWNINGFRALANRMATDGKTPLLIDYVSQEAPDVLFLSETRLNPDLVADLKSCLPGYTAHWNCTTEKKGYAGVAAFVRRDLSPVSVSTGIDDPKHDGEGRVIVVEFASFFLVQAYVANSGRGLPRLSYRVKSFDPAFHSFLTKKAALKPLILSGDLNVAYEEIDIWNSKANLRTAGHTVEERESFGKLLGAGFVDVYRYRHPTGRQYTYWSSRGNARADNKGWRLDYFVASKEISENCQDVITRETIKGSDHAPIVLLLKPPK